MALAKLDLRNIDFDLDGFLNAGGQLYTYAAGPGNVTDQATYSDADGTVNSNPIVFDSSGQYHLWLTEDLAYRFVFTDANDVPLYEEDGIFIRGEPTSTDAQYVVSEEYHGQTAPAASEWLGGHSFPFAVTFPINFSGAYGNINTNPTASFAIDVRQNATSTATGSSVGTITIATGGTYTFATAAAAEIAFEIGDHISFWGPSSADTTANDFNFTLVGEVQL